MQTNQIDRTITTSLKLFSILKSLIMTSFVRARKNSSFLYSQINSRNIFVSLGVFSVQSQTYSTGEMSTGRNFKSFIQFKQSVREFIISFWNWFHYFHNVFYSGFYQTMIVSFSYFFFCADRIWGAQQKKIFCVQKHTHTILQRVAH